MRIVLIIGLLVIQIFRFSAALSADGKEFEKDAACRACHENVGAMDEDHDFSCLQCHLMPDNRGKLDCDHSLIVRHPASPENVVQFCGTCHQKEIRQLQGSRHWTLAGMIAQTRFLWGAQKDPMPRYGAAANDCLEKIPEPLVTVQSPADLVDDLLQRRCFICHIGAVPPRTRGMFRGTGCAACHVLYENDGGARRVDTGAKDKKTGSGGHLFCRPIPTRQCMHCHNGPHVGGAYAGRCRHDFHSSYRTPLKDGYLPEKIYMMDHHRLSRDVHYEAGLLCVDCHNRNEVMGSPLAPGVKNYGVSVRCMDCHGIENSEGKDADSSRYGTFLSATGVRHRVPLRNPENPAHHIPGMEKVHCLGCHAAWGGTDFGASFIRDDREDLSRWAPWRMQSDASVGALFDHRGTFLGKPDTDGPGPWFLGWRFRRWEYLILGKDEKGRIVPFRPQHQYRVSYVDTDGRVVLDSVIPQRGDRTGPGWAFMPYYPHTVQPRGRSCEACHGSPLAAGKGLWEGKGTDLGLTRPSPPVYPSMGLLVQKERQHLLAKTQAYRKWRFKTLWWEYQRRE